jgi:hypothetical protein
MLPAQSGSSFFFIFIELPGGPVHWAQNKAAANGKGEDWHGAGNYVINCFACSNSSSNLMALTNLCFPWSFREGLRSRMPGSQNRESAQASGARRGMEMISLYI